MSSSGKVEAETEEQVAAAKDRDSMATANDSDDCSMGCFSTSVRSTPRGVPARQASHDLDSVKSGRNYCGGLEGPDSARWKCPDPGCKTNNHEGQRNCSNCKLPRHSTNQFKRSQSKILKQL